MPLRAVVIEIVLIGEQFFGTYFAPIFSLFAICRLADVNEFFEFFEFIALLGRFFLPGGRQGRG